MKKILALLLLLTAGQLFAQNNPITAINITLPANPDANVANWGTGTSMLIITATAKQANGRIDPQVQESKILVIIKKDGAKICGDYTANNAPGAEINSPSKVWSGTNAASLLGKGCVLLPGDYELSVQFFGNGAAGPAPLSDEKIKPFTIRGNDQQSYQAPQGIAPAMGAVLASADIKKPVTFRWTPVVPPPQTGNLVYQLKVFEVLKGQVPTQAVAANSPVLTADVNATQYIWKLPVEYTAASEPKTFAWTVQATSKDGKQAYGANNGNSEAMMFKTGGNPQPASTCGLTIAPPLLQCTGNGYSFTLNCLNTADPSTDPGCVINVTSITLPSAGGATITITSPLPAAVSPGQTVVISGTLSAAPQTPLFLVSFSGPNGSGSYGPSFTLPSAPPAPGAIAGPGIVCQSPASITYSIQPVNGANNYNWTVPAGAAIVSGQGTTSVTVSFQNSSPGNVCISTVNSCGTSAQTCKAVTITASPAQPGPITGSAAPCHGTTQTYSVPNVPGITYNWSVPVGWTITAGAGTNTITLTAGSGPATITVTPGISCGYGTARTLAVTGVSLPAQPASFSGPAVVCYGSTPAYSVPNVNEVSYTWQFPAGWAQTTGGVSNAVTALAANAGNIKITPFNACGNGPALTIAVTTTPLPAQPGVITGNSVPCHGSAQVYSVPGVNGVTYNWSFPAGWVITSGGTTNSVTVTAGTVAGNISVTASNACGSGPARTLAVTPAMAAPAAPGTMVGADWVCPGQSGGNYAINAVTGATSYIWSASGPVTISGGGVFVTAAFGITPGSNASICVKASNNCGTSAQSCFTVTIKGAPPTPAVNIATGIQATQFTAHWAAVNGAIGYDLDVSTSPVFATFITGYNNLGTGLVTAYNVTGLTCNTSYYYRVRALGVCNEVSGNSNASYLNTSIVLPQGNWANFATPATGVTPTQFTANWFTVLDIAYYKLDVSTNANFTSFVPGYNNLTVGTGISYAVTGLPTTGCPIYYYRVRAVTACGGVSPNSNVIMVTQPAPHGTWIKGPGSYAFTVGAFGSGATIQACPGQSIPVTMEIWGGGGGGAIPTPPDNWVGGTGGAGGGGGGYDKKVVNAVVPSIGKQIYYVVVGRGGSAGSFSKNPDYVGPYDSRSGGDGEITKVTSAGFSSPFLYTTTAHGGRWYWNFVVGFAGDGNTANHWKGTDGALAFVPTACPGSDGGLGGAGGGPGRTVPGYYNDGGNGGHGGYNRYIALFHDPCVSQSSDNAVSDGLPGGNGRAVFTW